MVAGEGKPVASHKNRSLTVATRKKAKTCFSFAQKMKILDRLKEGEARQTTLNAAMRSLERIINQEKRLRKEGKSSAVPTRKRKCVGVKEIEEAVSTCFEVLRSKKHITSPILLEKMEKIAKDLDSNFKPNTGWLHLVKTRSGIKFKRAHGEQNYDKFFNTRLGRTRPKGG